MANFIREAVNSGLPATPPAPADWILPLGAGQIVVTDDGGTEVTLNVQMGEVVRGPFKKITSTTIAAGIRYGNGLPPTAGPTPAQPATTGALGTVELSVAPANAATPVVVGDNDPRVTTLEIPITLSGSDGSLAEFPVPRAAIGCTVSGAYLNMGAAVAADDTNYLTLTLAKRNGSGGGATTIASGTTQITGGVNSGGGLLAFEEVSLGAVSNAALLASDVLTFKSVKTASGKASGAGKLRVTFTHP